MSRKKKDVQLDKTEKLIYDIIFGNKRNYSIKIGDYVDDLLQQEIFCSKVKTALIRTGYFLYDEDVKVDKTEMYWTFVLRQK
jgi:hypothetical protein